MKWGFSANYLFGTLCLLGLASGKPGQASGFADCRWSLVARQTPSTKAHRDVAADELVALFRVVDPGQSEKFYAEKSLQALRARRNAATFSLQSLPVLLLSGEMDLEEIITRNKILFHRAEAPELWPHLINYVVLLPADQHRRAVRQILKSHLEKIREILPFIHRPELQVMAYEENNSLWWRPPTSTSDLLALVGHVPYALLPDAIRKQLKDDWSIDLERNPPLRADRIKLMNFEDCYPAGSCPMMWKNHHLTSIQYVDHDDPFDGETGDVILVYFERQLIGTVKLRGDPTFLALRHVMDEQGRLVLVMGGVYLMSKLFNTHYVVQIGTQDNWWDPPPIYPKWRSVNVGFLDVFPKAFLMNTSAIEEGDVMAGSDSPERFLNAGYPLYRMKKAQRIRLWKELMVKFEELRQKLNPHETP